MKKRKFSATYEKLKDAIVMITSYYAPEGPARVGSGFLVEKNGHIYILTAAHVVLHTTVTDPMTSFFIGIYNVNNTGKNIVVKAKIVGVDASADVAVLSCCLSAATFKNHPVIRFAKNLAKTGDKILNISSPLNKDLQSFVTGRVRDAHWFDNAGTYIIGCLVTNLLVYPASSGSPVLDEDGRCVGIVAFGFVNGTVQQVGFGGGCDVHTLRRIFDNITEKRNVNKVLANDGSRFLTNLKAFLGNIGWIAADCFGLSAYFPDQIPRQIRIGENTRQIRGILLTQMDRDSPFANLIDAPPLGIGDIVVWGRKLNESKNNIWAARSKKDIQLPVGDLTWFINPQSSNVLVEFGVIRANQNETCRERCIEERCIEERGIEERCIERVTALLNRSYDPATEAPAENGLSEEASRNFDFVFNAFVIDPIDPFVILQQDQAIIVGLDKSIIYQETSSVFPTVLPENIKPYQIGTARNTLQVLFSQLTIPTFGPNTSGFVNVYLCVSMNERTDYGLLPGLSSVMLHPVNKTQSVTLSGLDISLNAYRFLVVFYTNTGQATRVAQLVTTLTIGTG